MGRKTKRSSARLKRVRDARKMKTKGKSKVRRAVKRVAAKIKTKTKAKRKRPLPGSKVRTKAPVQEPERTSAPEPVDGVVDTGTEVQTPVDEAFKRVMGDGIGRGSGNDEFTEEDASEEDVHGSEGDPDNPGVI